MATVNTRRSLLRVSIIAAMAVSAGADLRHEP
jgi:hypothetical protein